MRSIFLLTIARTAPEEDVLAYIYAEKRTNREFDPAAGDLIQCLAWFVPILSLRAADPEGWR